MKLPAEELTHHIPISALEIDNRQNTHPSNLTPCQARASQALQQGIAIRQPGYNLFLAGTSGTGRIRYAMNYLKPLASQSITPQDWLYVNNFDNPAEPRAISMPSEQGIALIRNIEYLIDALLATFPIVFENPSYLQQKAAMQKSFDQTYDRAVEAIERAAASRNIAVYRENGTITFTPIIKGQAADEALFAQQSDEQREEFRQHVDELGGLLNDNLLELPQWQRDLNDNLRVLHATTIKQSLKPLIEQLQQKHQGHTGIQLYLAQINRHLPRVIEEHLSDIEDNPKEKPSNKRSLLEELYLPNQLTRSAINAGSPIVQESNPSYSNLFGRINATPEQGTINSNYRQIIAGALHRANGGYLILDIEKVLHDPATWEALKRSLRDGKIFIEPSPSEMQMGFPQLIKPEPIPLDIKIILIGPREIYYTLERHDNDFDELFRVLVDFNNDIECNTENLQQFAYALQHRAHQAGLAKLTTAAIKKLTEYACRMAEHQDKFTAAIDPLMEVVVEANHCLEHTALSVIGPDHIERAIQHRTQRNSRLYETIKEDILLGRTVITTTGTAAGQVNGLSLIQVGETNFGCPVRITATAHPGDLGVVDIEREVQLGQAVHSKGIMLLAGYLCGRYCREFPLALSAHIAMEQSYGYVDGDSASLAELCALLSALLSVTLRQDLAITGSVNQRGEVQAVGGINEKIEGFFDICNARQLTGQQGVIIPASNSSNLMLSEDVITAVSNNQFAIYTVSCVDETMNLLTGVTIGKEDTKGNFPAGSFNHQVIQRLNQFTQLMAHRKS